MSVDSTPPMNHANNQRWMNAVTRSTSRRFQLQACRRHWRGQIPTLQNKLEFFVCPEEYGVTPDSALDVVGSDTPAILAT